jgi:hypothetical protein
MTPIDTSHYQGTGGYEGMPALAGMPKPIGFGRIIRAKATLLDSVLCLYHVNNGPIESHMRVFDSKEEYNQLDDHVDLLIWQPTIVEVSLMGFRADTARGMFRLSVKPRGLVLADFVAL